MQKFAPGLYKDMNKQISNAMVPIRDKARGYVKDDGFMLSGWTKPFASSQTAKYRAFPRYDSSQMRKGIVYRQGASASNSKGFKSIYYLANNSAPGAIFETSGRLTSSTRKNESLNPNSRAQFLARIEANSTMLGKDKKRGRLLYRAWDEDNGKAYAAVLGALGDATAKFTQGTYMDKKTYGLAA